jgi:hypothetical protein
MSTTRRRPRTKTPRDPSTRMSHISRGDYRSLAALYHGYGAGEIVRAIASLIETDEDLHGMDGVHTLSKRMHDVGDDLLRLAEVQRTTGSLVYGTA